MGYVKPKSNYAYEVFVAPGHGIIAIDWLKKTLPDRKWNHPDITNEYASGLCIGTTVKFMARNKDIALEFSKRFSNGGIL